MPQSPARTTRLEARLSPDSLAVLKRAAEIQGRSLSDFVVSAAQEAAHKAIAETQIVRIALVDQQALSAALADPPEPVDALRRASQAHRRLISSSR